MKKILSLIAITLVCAACNITPQQKAESAVKEHVKSTLDDPNSYESVSFNTIKGMGRVAPLHTPESKMPHCCYIWEIKHIYRHKNKFNALVLDSATFEIDSLETHVLATKHYGSSFL